MRILAALILTWTCIAAVEDAHAGTGIQGQVYEATTCDPGLVCVQLVKTRSYALRLIDLSSRRVLRTFRTQNSGRFALRTRPGIYRLIVHVRGGSVRPRLRGAEWIKVRASGFSDIVARIVPRTSGGESTEISLMQR